MRLNKFCMLLLALFLISYSGTALAVPCEDPSYTTERQSAYETLRKEFFSSMKEVRHLMISGPAVSDIIDIKDALRDIHNLQNQYAHAKTEGRPLTALADQYFTLLGKVDTLHNQLYERIEPASTRANIAWMILKDEYSDFVTPCKDEFTTCIEETREYAKPINIGVERLTEYREECLKEIDARLLANPRLVLTDDVQQDILRAAALRVLDKRIATPEGVDGCCQ